MSDGVQEKAGAVQVDVEAALGAFQEAARKMLKRIYHDTKYAHLMYGTDVYESFLKAYALSLGKSLPEISSLTAVDAIWKELHA